MNKSLFKVFSLITILALMFMALPMQSAQADNTAQTLPFSQDWTNTGLITINDDWSGVTGIVGFLGQDITTVTGTDPQTLLGVSGVANDVDVIANQTAPNTLVTGGVAEFHIADPVIALNGSGTADAPHIILYLNTTGQSNVTIAYNLRDLDGSADNSIQPVALQYRVGSSGNFTNILAGFVADATTSSAATLVTPVNVLLPGAVDNQSDVQIRIITTNAVGNDEWVGIDDISVTGASTPTPTNPSGVGAANPNTVTLGGTTLLTVAVTPGANPTSSGLAVACDLTAIGGSATQTFFDDNTNGDVTTGDNTFSFQATVDSGTSTGAKNISCTITDAQSRSGSTSISLSMQAAQSSAPVVISQVYGGGGNSGATYKNDFIELYNRSGSPVDLTGWSVQYASATGTSWTNKTDLSGVIQPGQYYLIQEAAGTGGTVDLPTPNATGSIAMGGTIGKVALVNNATPLTGTGCPFGATVVDFVGYGTTANCSETSPTATLSNTTAAIRKLSGAQDTDNNNADFDVAAPNPRNTPPPAPNLTINDVSLNEGNSGTTTFTFTVSLSSPAGAGSVTFDIATTDNSATSPSDFTAKTLTGQNISTGNSSYTFDVLVNGDTTDEPEETFFVNVTNVTGAIVVDGQGLGTILNDDVDFCAQSYTPIYQIQGSGSSTPIPGNVTTKGVVVGDFEGTAAASGFYIQDLTGDGDPATSDGIFVYTGNSNLVSVGQVVRVTGYARERFDQTTINGSNSNSAAVPAANIVQCGTSSVAPTDVSLPVTNLNDFERYEGMLVRFPQPLVIAEYFNYDRFGEIVLAQPLAGETRPFTGTAIDDPGAPANARTAANALSRITLDDVQSAQNPSVLRHPSGTSFSLTNKFRGGDTVQNAIGVLGYDFSLYRIVPTGPADYVPANPRPASPEPVGGTFRVAAMNTLNYFVTADYPTGDPLDNKCGPLQNVECRGWDSDQTDEFTRQRTKLLAALSGLDADIISLNELENSTGVEPLASIVSGLPGYDYIATGTIGTDAIKVGMIYRDAVVTPVGDFKLLTSAVDPRFLDTKNRPSLAQTFMVNATGAHFTIVINHFKSKGSDCLDVGDPDLGDGQGNCSQTRRAAAKALVDWLATDPTGSGDPDFIIMGDLNSYAMEDTITEILAGADDAAGTSDDYTNLIYKFQGKYAYSYTFDGQAGYLDHALASRSLLAQVTGAADWHINSDEPDVLDYDTSFKPASQDALYEPNQYRTSDHDPVVVGLIPNAPPTVDAGGPYSVDEGGSVRVTASGSDPNGDSLTYAWDLDNNGSFETSGQTVTFSAALLDGPSSYTINVKATDPGGLFSVSTATVNVANVAPTVSASFTTNSVSCGANNSSLNVSFTDPGIADTHTALVNWGDGNTQTVSPATSPFSLQHTYALAGTYITTVTVTDDDGGAGTTTAMVTVNFNTSGFLPPINANGTSVFKYNSTIPVKIRFTNCDGSTPENLAPTIKLTMISGATPGLEINEPTSTSAADTTGLMRYSSKQYIYNLATKPLPDPSATYLITVTIPYNGQTATVQFGLR